MADRYAPKTPQVTVAQADANSRPGAVIRVALSKNDDGRRLTLEEAKSLQAQLGQAIRQVEAGDVPPVPPRPHANAAALPAA